MYSDPNTYKHLKVFITPEKDDEGTYLQVYADPENHEQNLIVSIMDPNLDVSMDDYIEIKGKVQGEFKGENMMGGEIVIPSIEAESIEVVDYMTAVAPTINSIEVQQEQNQHGLQITLEKIEFAESHTRVYVEIQNDTDDEATIHTYSSKLIVGNEQYESESIYEADYPELQSDILPGVESSGIITFPAIDPDTTSLQYHISGSSRNWELDIEPFIFEVK